MIKTRNLRIAKIATLAISLAFFAGVNVTQATVLNSANVVTLVNQSRTSAGVSALTVSDKLTAAAQAKAEDMFAKQYFAHVGPDGFGPEHWFSLAGYNWTYMGENIAYGHSTAETVHDAFMASPGHKANIMGVNYKNVGIAAVSGTYNGRTTVMVVEEFGTTNTPESTTTYPLTVSGGTGSGSYASGKTVTITAAAPAAGKVFDKWTGDITYLANAATATTTVNMPDKGIELTATYKDPAATSTYPNGTLLKLGTSSKIYVIIDGKKKWISIPEVFEQLGYKWTNIKVVTVAELDKYPDYEDNLVRVRGDIKVYLIVNGVRRHIPNPKIFLDYGFNWNDIKDVNTAAMGKYKDTMIIKESGKADIYLLTYGGIKKFVPSTDVLKTYNTKAEDIQVVSKTEMESYPVCNVIKLKDSKDVYLIDGNTKKRIPNPAAFQKYRLDWNRVVDVNETDFNFYQNKGDLN